LQGVFQYNNCNKLIHSVILQHAVHHNFVVMETEKTLFFILKPFWFQWFVKCSETFITSDLTVIVKFSLSCVS